MPGPRPPLTSILHASLILKGTLDSNGPTNLRPSATFYYKRTNTTNPPSKAQLHAAFLAGPYAAMLAAFSSDWSAGSTNIRWLEDAEDPTVTTTLAGTGAIATDRAPSFTAVYMNLQSNSRARWARGSKHFTALNEIDTTKDILTGAGLARWQAVQAAILANLTDAGGNIWQPCIVAGAPASQLRTNPTTVVSSLVTAIVLNLSIGRMKKRQSKSVV